MRLRIMDERLPGLLHHLRRAAQSVQCASSAGSEGRERAGASLAAENDIASGKGQGAGAKRRQCPVPTGVAQGISLVGQIAVCGMARTGENASCQSPCSSAASGVAPGRVSSLCLDIGRLVRQQSQRAVASYAQASRQDRGLFPLGSRLRDSVPGAGLSLDDAQAGSESVYRSQERLERAAYPAATARLCQLSSYVTSTMIRIAYLTRVRRGNRSAIKQIYACP